MLSRHQLRVALFLLLAAMAAATAAAIGIARAHQPPLAGIVPGAVAATPTAEVEAAAISVGSKASGHWLRTALSAPAAAKYDLVGQVLETRTGAARSRFRVTWSREGQPAGARMRRETTDGSFRICGLDPGRYLVTATNDGAQGEAHAVVTVPQVSPLRLSLEAGARILALVVDGRGRPVADAPVHVRGTVDFSGRSDPDGGLVVAVPPGDYEVAVDGWPGPAVQVRVPPAGDAPAELRLAAAGTMRVLACDGAGAPLPAADVLLWSRAGVRRRATTAGDGSAVIQGLPPGRYTLHLGHPRCRGEQRVVEVLDRRETQATLALVARS